MLNLSPYRVFSPSSDQRGFGAVRLPESLWRMLRIALSRDSAPCPAPNRTHNGPKKERNSSARAIVSA